LNTYNTTLALTALGFQLGDVSLKFVEVVYAIVADSYGADLAGFNRFDQL